MPELGIEPGTPGPKPSTLSTRLSLAIIPSNNPVRYFLTQMSVFRLIGVTDAPIQPSIQSSGDIVTVIIAENDNARGIIQFDVDRVSILACSSDGMNALYHH